MPLTPFPRLTSLQEGATWLLGDVWAQWMNALRRAVNLTPGNTVPVLFVNLPTPVPGSLQVITDSTTNTWGAVVAGGGAFTVTAHWNGTNWTVAAK